jgi:predicted DCC family thiol-disulfide oxidoreductase YuxK
VSRDAEGRRSPSYAVGMDLVTVLYDRDCGFCTWSAEKLRSWDGRRERLRFVPLQTAEADDLLGPMGRDERFASWHAVTRGDVYSGGAAMGPVLRAVPGGFPAAVIAERFPRTTERLYRLVVANRLRLAAALGREACAVDPSRPRV